MLEVSVVLKLKYNKLVCFTYFNLIIFYMLRNNTTSKNVANSLYFYNMFRPVVGHHQVVYSSHKTKLYQDEVCPFQKLDMLVTLKLLFQTMV
jgi:hypothetical protein